MGENQNDLLLKSNTTGFYLVLIAGLCLA